MGAMRWIRRLPLAAGGLLGAAALLLVPGRASADFLEVDAYPTLAANLQLESGAGTEVIAFTGSAQFHVTFPTTEGSASDGNGNGREEVPVELVALSLSGSSSLGLGTVEIGLSSTPSTGMIEEVVNNTAGVLDIPPFTATGAAEMSLDAYLAVSIGGLATYFNMAAIPMIGAISHKPSTPAQLVAILESFPRTRLYTSSTKPPTATDYFLGVPEPSQAALLGSVFAALAALRGVRRAPRERFRA
jgi:hypothetical protein